MEMVVGVTGYRRCGKDSTVKLLVQHFGFKRFAFADSLRNMARAINPVISLDGSSAELLERLHRGKSDHYEYRYAELFDTLGYELAKEIPDFRSYLQRLGTEGVRATFGPNAWVDALALSIYAAIEDVPERIALSDVRFGSEASFVLSRPKGSGILWRIIRPGVGGDDPHPSEVEIPTLPATREITATSLAELEDAVLEAAKEDLGLVPSTTVPSNATTSSSSSAGAAPAVDARDHAAGEGTGSA